jgi:hypothetical protein
MSALEKLISGTVYSGYYRVSTRTTGGEPYDDRNLVTLSRFPVVEDANIRDSDGPRPSYKPATVSGRSSPSVEISTPRATKCRFERSADRWRRRATRSTRRG